MSDATSETVATFSYLPSGRVGLLSFRDDGGISVLETPDDSGMARPGSFQLGGGDFAWSEGDYSYDGSGNIVGIGAKTYAYDGNGERVATWRRNLADGDALVDATFHIRDEAGHVLSDWMYLPDDYFDMQRDHVVAGGKIIAKMTNATDAITYLVSDHLGSTRVEVAENGDAVNTGGDSGEETQTDYYPFGRRREDLGEPVDLRHRFTGHERDSGAGSAELDYMHARYYSSSLGRLNRCTDVGCLTRRCGGRTGRVQGACIMTSLPLC